MRIFISAGEPSGDLHGSNLIRVLKELSPETECVGFGGDNMEAAGCRLVYPLCELAVIGFARVLAKVPVFLRLLSEADRYFSRHKPDAVVLIDFPGFNWWIARRAHYHGIPVFYFVPPQLWGWAGWRVKKMQRWVDHVLCSLPFEEAWYHKRGVQAKYIGHPYFDELRQQRLNDAFLTAQQARPGTIVGILPGSRHQEVSHNLPMLIRAAERIASARADTRFLVACFKETQQREVDAYLRDRGLAIETFVGRTPEIIHLSRACMAVSGSVGLELLFREKPAVVVYRIGRLGFKFSQLVRTSPYISLVNLLAGKELFPEFLTDHCEAEAMATHVLRWLDDPVLLARVREELRGIRDQVAEPGACERAARCVLDTLGTARSLRCA